MDLNNGLGATIKALRKARGMTQAELAKAVGMERTSVTNIERGSQQLTVKTINALANAMGYEVRVKFVQARNEPANAKLTGPSAGHGDTDEHH